MVVGCLWRRKREQGLAFLALRGFSCVRGGYHGRVLLHLVVLQSRIHGSFLLGQGPIFFFCLTFRPPESFPAPVGFDPS